MTEREFFFNRSPDPIFKKSDDATFQKNSALAHDLFLNEFKAGRLQSIDAEGLKKLLDEMRYFYGPSDGAIYRDCEENFRGALVRRWMAHEYGPDRMASLGFSRSVALVPYSENAPSWYAPLPELESSQSSLFWEKGRHLYPELSPENQTAYYTVMARKLRGFFHAVDRSDALDFLLDFGRLASHFRQYRRGNWGLYGPIILSLLGSLGYKVQYTGFMDLIFQQASPESLKKFFPVALAAELPFYSEDGFNPLSLSSRQSIIQPINQPYVPTDVRVEF